MTISQITDHFEKGLKRLLEQYKNKPNIKALIEIYSIQIQEIENEIIQMRVNRFITNAVGKQLDNFGEIVGQPRLGFSDEFYRVLLYAKIGQNISQGLPEQIIALFKLFTNGSTVQYMNLNGAEIALATDGTIEPTILNFVFDQMQRSVAAGVRLTDMIFFDSDEAFSFAGTKAGKGFGSVNDANAGGKFATLKRKVPPFSFAGSRLSDGGFGTINDPLEGGGFISAT